MTNERGSSASDPMRMNAQMWESGYQAMADGMRQAQEFWNGVARSWGGATGAMLNQPSGVGGGEAMDVLRELQESAFNVGQAWMRLPMSFLSGARPEDLQEAVTRLAEAQGRAFQLWMDAISRGGLSGMNLMNTAVTGAERESQRGEGRGRS